MPTSRPMIQINFWFNHRTAFLCFVITVWDFYCPRCCWKTIRLCESAHPLCVVPLIGCFLACGPRPPPDRPNLWSPGRPCRWWSTRRTSAERGTWWIHLSVGGNRQNSNSSLNTLFFWGFFFLPFVLRISTHAAISLPSSWRPSCLLGRRYPRRRTRSPGWRLCCPCLRCMSLRTCQAPTSQTLSPSWWWWRGARWPGTALWSDPGWGDEKWV